MFFKHGEDCGLDLIIVRPLVSKYTFYFFLSFSSRHLPEILDHLIHEFSRASRYLIAEFTHHCLAKSKFLSECELEFCRFELRVMFELVFYEVDEVFRPHEHRVKTRISEICLKKSWFHCHLFPCFFWGIKWNWFDYRNCSCFEEMSKQGIISTLITSGIFFIFPTSTYNIVFFIFFYFFFPLTHTPSRSGRIHAIMERDGISWSGKLCDGWKLFIIFLIFWDESAIFVEYQFSEFFSIFTVILKGCQKFFRRFHLRETSGKFFTFKYIEKFTILIYFLWFSIARYWNCPICPVNIFDGKYPKVIIIRLSDLDCRSSLDGIFGSRGIDFIERRIEGCEILNILRKYSFLEIPLLDRLVHMGLRR
ncbi:MAG: hypothetical protein ACD_71C00246G0001 [uncultured bacterium (gcode 4)]|uniref:Uncharacterized protein n=1 Tax=uncultured bacterium (gcode 4) TaxID=1234023 RepID=K1Z3G1_9BACT|nr:MAG: hypothetical protein ACD_71C00246G0001 [uncultured bacterium (gcode 4)]